MSRSDIFACFLSLIVLAAGFLFGGPIAGFVVLFAAVLFLVWWFFKDDADSVHVAPADLPKERKPVIGFLCEPNALPIPLPKGSTIHTLCTQEGNGMAHEMSLSPEDDVWHPYPKSDSVYRCELTNYGEVPVFGVSMSFRVTLRELVRQQGIWTSGKVVSSHVQIAEVPLIGANGGSYVFYVWNSGEQCAEVFAPESVTLESTEGHERIQVRLKSTGTHGPACMMLLPGRR